MSPAMFAVVDAMLLLDVEDAVTYDWGSPDEVGEAIEALGWWRSTWCVR